MKRKTTYFLPLLLLAFLWPLCSPAQQGFFRLPENAGPDDYVEGVIIYKIKNMEKGPSEYQEAMYSLERALADIGASDPARVFISGLCVAQAYGFTGATAFQVVRIAANWKARL